MSDISLNIKRTWDSIAKPLESLGRLETLVAKLGAAQNKEHPAVAKSALLVLCADQNTSFAVLRLRAAVKANPASSGHLAEYRQ